MYACVSEWVGVDVGGYECAGMYVRMYVHMYACMCVRMYEWTYVCMCTFMHE